MARFRHIIGISAYNDVGYRNMRRVQGRGQGSEPSFFSLRS